MKLGGFDLKVRFDCSIARLLDAAAGVGLGLVVGLDLAGLTSTRVAALHVGSKRLLAGFDALSGSHTLELLRSRRLHGLKSSGGCCEAI